MEELRTLNISEIHPNPYQPRIHFDEKELLELAQSIKENGLIQPIIVRKSSIIGYELLAGERRLRASQLAGLTTIPAVVKELTDDDLLYQAIIENLQRSNLNPIEEAASYQKLISRGLTHDEVAQIMGKSRPYISNLLRLLNLSYQTKQAVEEGQISQGHARQLVSFSEEKQAEWVQLILSKDLSVRTLEKLIAANKKKHTKLKQRDQFLKEQEDSLSKTLGTATKIIKKKNGSGEIRISFNDLDEFERIINNFK
ncbi:TPA: ParB/RepB/Spo0J family partition protein [Streptococcus suis]|nr:ParB/RepB/Spo0J family partition protein [Streptococcus suis]HEM4039322.1 ParB/RepB/Spo0J family partition protein [Streptococcus suis]